jgi:hypothetical protein
MTERTISSVSFDNKLIKQIELNLHARKLVIILAMALHGTSYERNKALRLSKDLLNEAKIFLSENVLYQAASNLSFEHDELKHIGFFKLSTSLTTHSNLTPLMEGRNRQLFLSLKNRYSIEDLACVFPVNEQKTVLLSELVIWCLSAFSANIPCRIRSKRAFNYYDNSSFISVLVYDEANKQLHVSKDELRRWLHYKMII